MRVCDVAPFRRGAALRSVQNRPIRVDPAKHWGCEMRQLFHVVTVRLLVAVVIQ